MSWWLVGLSAFVSNFSAWTFTGAAGLAFEYGIIVFIVYACDVFGYALGYFYFAKRFRQMRLVTAMDAVRDRFGKTSEQVFTWVKVPIQLITAGVWLVGLSIILSAVFNLPQEPTAVVTGITVLVMALLGGSWAVTASDFIQGLLLVSISIAAGVLCLVEVGGISEFIKQIPAENLTVLHETGAKHDWLWVIAMFCLAIVNRNNIMQSAKYITVKDSQHASKAAAVPLILYALLPVFWFIPPLCAHTLVPDFQSTYSAINNPSEVAYIAPCLEVLPQGMIGLLTAGLFAATMSSMDTGLNRNSGFLIKNFYQKIIRPKASDKQLLFAGQVCTLIMGILVIGIALIFINMGKISLFDIVMILITMLSIPVFVPLFWGMFIKRPPFMSAWTTMLFGLFISFLVYKVSMTEFAMSLFQSLNAEAVLEYIRTHKTAANIFINIPLSSGWFLLSGYIFKAGKEERQQIDKFFEQMEAPVDFEAEGGVSNDKDQAATLGKLSLVYGSFVLLMLLIPNTFVERVTLAGCALFMLGVGFLLVKFSSKKESSQEDPVINENNLKKGRSLVQSE
ncbi:MAG: hypothetical protein MK132_19325 [Lentisphaerales bacterium]|nr:hypothetical protein [Lentisphaerales bacterium]